MKQLQSLLVLGTVLVGMSLASVPNSKTETVSYKTWWGATFSVSYAQKVGKVTVTF